jgi:hypothetical protein
MIASGLSASEGPGGVPYASCCAVQQGVRMGIHGGVMDRSLSRFSVLVGSAFAVGALLAGCAADVPGPAVIGVPPSSTSGAAPAAGDFLAGLDQAVANELNSINSTQTDNEPPAVLIELNALNSQSALIQAETFSSLIGTGANQIAKREHLVGALIGDVKGNTYLSGVDVNGSPLSGTLLAMLGGVSGQLQSQANSIDSATLIDVLRSVILTIGPSTRVFGLVEPMIHLAIAGGDELKAVSYLEGQYQTLARKIGHNEGGNVAQETVLLQDLAAKIATVRSTATADVQAVLALTPAGYPGNKSTILNVRAQLTQLRAPLGPLTSAGGDVDEIQTLLSQHA